MSPARSAGITGYQILKKLFGNAGLALLTLENGSMCG